ncbi:MAG: hypothetical protein M1113_04225 [Candidatus Thermoplasmatota archaeon]|jgi:hypothetical protein|nr:hypothetical protein [Candidatus Thermoplasmatota archaeon]
MPSFYSKVFLVGEPIDNEFFGNDIAPKFMILQQEGNRVSLQVFYLDDKIRLISKIRTVVPDSPESQYALLDASIAFYPQFFKDCASLMNVKEQLKNTTFLDLDLNMPEGWKNLRKEAFPYFKKLRINTATFEENWRVDR